MRCTQRWIKANQNDNVDDEDKDEDNIKVVVSEPVQQSFSIKFLTYFTTKATALSPQVRISMGQDVPLEVSYGIEQTGYLRYYLAPKIEDDD